MEQQAASGLSARAWCVQKAIGYATFMYWRRRLVQRTKAAPLTLIRVIEEDAVSDGLWLLVGGARIEVKGGFDAALLKQVVAALVS
ncbi:hypothetical protein [Methylococcus sp. Mc7]|uniref:IS66 family insertion sequence element accessory protein TnpA n=1 Tax=Methylococcus sp. Mc7 TaxID=2860258 RepID=UPI001C531F03|nr:hypothetical protein [Methylococcus sp. Mc7]QXP83598.1 hypothetical protein KW115_15755 [Methylococcus sp. Mc7]